MHRGRVREPGMFSASLGRALGVEHRARIEDVKDLEGL